MSNEKLSNEKISLLAKGLKFVPTPQTSKKGIFRKHIMQDFNDFARRMRIRYAFANQKKKQHLARFTLNQTGNHLSRNPLP